MFFSYLCHIMAFLYTIFTTHFLVRLLHSYYTLFALKYIKIHRILYFLQFYKNSADPLFSNNFSCINKLIRCLLIYIIILSVLVQICLTSIDFSAFFELIVCTTTQLLHTFSSIFYDFIVIANDFFNVSKRFFRRDMRIQVHCHFQCCMTQI